MDGQIDPKFPVLITAKLDASVHGDVKSAIGGEHQAISNYRGSGRSVDVFSWKTTKDRLFPEAYAQFVFGDSNDVHQKVLEATFANMEAVNQFFHKLSEANIVVEGMIATKQNAQKVFGLMDELLAVGQKQDRGVTGS